MMEPAERTAETTMQEEAATPKPGRDSGGAASAAEEILNVFESKIGESPEADKLKTIIRKLEESLQEEFKKKNAPGLSASSQIGSWVIIEDDPMKPKSPRTKRTSPGNGSRPPTPEGKKET